MNKAIVTVLVGIATLIGSASSIATDGDEKCYKHVVANVRITDNEHTWIHIVDVYGKGPFDGKYEVYNQMGNSITYTYPTNYVENFTVPLNGAYFLTTPNVKGHRDGRGDRFRHVHITTDEDAVVAAKARVIDLGMYNIPVTKWELTNRKIWPEPCDDPDEKS